MKQLKVSKIGDKYSIKLYGTEWELILPEEKRVPEKKKKSRKTTPKVASKTTKKSKKGSK